MLACYSTIDPQFSAEFGALLPNLTRTVLDRQCRYVDHNNKVFNGFLGYVPI